MTRSPELLQLRTSSVLRPVSVSQPEPSSDQQAHATTPGSLHAACDVSVAVSGEVDLANAGALRDGLFVALATVPARGRLLVDLADVSFLDCCGLGAVVAVRNSALASDRGLHLIRPTARIERLLSLARLGHFVTAA